MLTLNDNALKYLIILKYYLYKVFVLGNFHSELWEVRVLKPVCHDAVVLVSDSQEEWFVFFIYCIFLKMIQVVQLYSLYIAECVGIWDGGLLLLLVYFCVHVCVCVCACIRVCVCVCARTHACFSVFEAVSCYIAPVDLNLVTPPPASAFRISGMCHAPTRTSELSFPLLTSYLCGHGCH